MSLPSFLIPKLANLTLNLNYSQYFMRVATRPLAILRILLEQALLSERDSHFDRYPSFFVHYFSSDMDHVFQNLRRCTLLHSCEHFN